MLRAIPSDAIYDAFERVRASLLVLASLLLALPLFACVRSRRVTPGAGGTSSLPLTPCALTAPGAGVVIHARCGTLEVWEDREARSGRKIPLRVAVVPASGRDVKPDPLFILAGGPGQAAIRTYPMLAGAFGRIH